MQNLNQQSKNQTLPKEWRRVKLGKVVEITSSKRIFAREYVNNGVPFYRGKEIIEKFKGRNVSTNLFISEDKFYEIEKRFGIPQYGDILLTSVGTLGIPYIVKKNEKFYFKDGNLTWFRKFNGIDNNFLYYWIQSSIGKAKIMKQTIGSSQPALTIEGLKEIEIDLPLVDEQRRIASILSSFDEKIEVNNKINEKLENLGREIFKQLFKKQNLGKWVKGYLGDKKCSEIITPKINEFNGEKIYLATSDVNGTEIINTKTKITYFNRPIRANCQPILNSIWFAKMANTYKVLFFSENNKDDINKYILSTGFMGLKCLNNMHYYLYFFINSKEFHKLKDSLVQGAVQEAITNNNIRNIDILIPPQSLIQEFNSQVELLINKIFLNKLENEKLVKLRDLLLSKLIRGEIRV